MSGMEAVLNGGPSRGAPRCDSLRATGGGSCGGGTGLTPQPRHQIGIGHVGHAGAHQRVLNVEHLGDAGFHGQSVDRVGRIGQSNEYYINRDILISTVSMR